MGNFTIDALSGGLFFIVGLIVGALWHRAAAGEASKNRRLEQRISELQESSTRYRAEVSEHFMHTAHLINRMNQSYKDVHQHLAQGAGKLCQDSQPEDFVEVSFDSAAKNINHQQGGGKESEVGLDSAPKDYAPKMTPEDAGTLSEGYGLKAG